MKKLRLESLKFILIIALILGTLTTSVFAWFSAKFNTISTKITGSIVFEYFHKGDGTRENPFVITRPIHYYHMVEFFQRITSLGTGEDEKALFGREFLYFQIGCPLAQLADPDNDSDPVSEDDWYVFDYSNTGGVIEYDGSGIRVGQTSATASKTLNMAYYSGERALMPVGSSQIPFLGYIDGHNMTIDNLHIVANSIVNVVDDFGVVTTNVSRTTCDIGVFGCVSPGFDVDGGGTIEDDPENEIYEQTTIKNIYITNATIDLESTATATEMVSGVPSIPDGEGNQMQVHSNDFHHVNENGEVDPNANEAAYVGYVAGHVYSTNKITDVYINNSRIIGGSRSMSGYGYFGLIIDPETNEAVSALGSQIANIYTQGDASGFGGSIGMTDLFGRLANVRNESSNIKNITAETVLVDEVTGTTTRIATQYANVNAYNPSKAQGEENIQYYYEPSSGLYYVYFRGNNTQGYNYLWGENTILNTKTVTTITFEKDNETGTYRMTEGYKIIEGESNYLGANATTGGASVNYVATTSENAIVLSFDQSNHLYFTAKVPFTQQYDYPYNDNENPYIDTIYYINAANNYMGVSASTTGTTTWAFDESDRLYTTNGNTRYYIDYNNGAWYLTSQTSFYYLKDDQGNFLTINNTSIQNTEVEGNASKLEMTNPTGSTTISTIINDNRYYFRNNAGTLELSTTNNNNTWSYDSTTSGYYVTIGSTKYFIVFDDGSWRLRPEGFDYKLYNGNNYLTATSATALGNTTNAAQALYWNMDPDAATTTISTIYNGTVAYLGIYNGALALNSSYSGTQWTKDGEGNYYVTYQNTKFYLVYNNGWEVDYSGYKIYTSTNYLNANSTTTVNNITTGAANASTWIFDPDAATTEFYTFVNGTKVYLARNDYGLSASTTPTTWTKESDGKYYVTYDGLNLYIAFTNNAWVLDYQGHKINNGATNYLTATSTTAFGNTTEANALVWILDTAAATTTISTIHNGTKTYLGINNNALALNTSYSSTLWTKDANGRYYREIAGEKAYITYDNNTWKILFDGYKISNGATNYLTATSTTAFGNTTEANALVWFLDTSAATTTISTIYNGTKTYLGVNGYNLALNTSYSGTQWTKDGNNYYVTVDGIKLYLTYDNGWVVVYDYSTIKDTSGNYYLNASNATTIANATTANAAGKWILDTSAATTTISILYSGTKTYLGVNNNEEIALNTSYSSTLWTKDGNTYYTTYNGINYYITYRYGAWRVLPRECISFKMGNFYMRIYSTTAVRSNTNTSDQTQYYRDSQNRYYGFYNNNKYYITKNNNNQVTLSNNVANALTLIMDGNSVYDSSSPTRFLNLTGTSTSSSTVWQFAECYTISDGNGNYLRVTGTNTTSFGNTTNVADATKFIFNGTNTKTIGTIYNGSFVYLRNRNNSLQVSTTSTSWTVTANSIYNSNRYIRYNNGWALEQATRQVTITSAGPNIVTTTNNTYTQTITNNVPTKNTAFNKTTFNLATNEHTPTFNFTSLAYSGINAFSLNSFEMIYAVSDSIQLEVGRSLSEQRMFSITSTESNLPTGLTTYIPIRVAVNDDSDYDAQNPYKASLKNTGYIVGGGKYYESGNSVGDIRVSRYPISNINSYSNYQTYNRLYTVTDNGSGGMTNRQLTQADVDKFISFNDRTGTVKDENGEHEETFPGAKTQFDAMITNYADGLHFMDAAISMSNIITVPQVTILNRTYYNYQLPGDCIDFKVLKRGAISFFAGEYFTGNNAFFSLHQIIRDENQNITDIKEIQYVYKYKAAELGLADYIYLYKDDTYGRINQETGEFEVVEYSDINNVLTYYEVTFNTDWITEPTGVSANNKRVYYFEIPCNKGEYALGSVDGKIGAYLLYLDIAANGGDEVDSVVSGQGNEVSTSFKVDFRNPGDTSEFAIMQLFINCPQEIDASERDVYSRLFSVNVVFDSTETGDGVYSSGIYNIYITNKVPDKTAKISVFLVDNDNDIMTPFPYAYRIVYTNLEHTNTTITNIAELDFYQSVATFEIPSTGEAAEATY